MAYYLKKTKRNNKTYLAIDESFYSHKKKGTAHKCFKSLGSVESNEKKGIENPIAYYTEEVNKLNDEKKNMKEAKIGDTSISKYLGYFPLKSILEKLNIKFYIDYYNNITDYRFNLYSLLSSLIYARSVFPCSKQRTYNEVIPNLFEEYNFSYDQLLDGLELYGNLYERIVELFTTQVNKVYGIKTDVTYFDCTNFYFEIDREDDFRRKGPSKENQKSPIIGLGLLLDANQIPIGMKMYPGNESEKPILRDVINSLKKQNDVSGRTVHVADKGLNCADNIVNSLKNHDGYLFSKSVIQLSEVEKQWVLLDNDWKIVEDHNGVPIYKYKSCIDEFEYTITNNKNKKQKLPIKEKRVLTYNYSLAKKKKAEITKMVEKASRMCLSEAKKSEFGESVKYTNFDSIDQQGNETGKKAKISINQNKIDKDLQFAGYNLLVTSEVNMDDIDIYNTYHNLWRIEESFKIMKSDIDARPVFLQKENTIKGHFLVCYLTVLLERLFQFKTLESKYSSSEVIDFIKGFKLAKPEDKYINLSFKSRLLIDLVERYNLQLDNLFISEIQVNKILNQNM